ncbi:MAG: tryptophan-rich sensory protein [Firmicutes bacterium]|nr:tryptophan-rich sensory protein [Bacillota bacterium]
MKLSRKLFYLFLPVILGSVVGFIISGSIDYNQLVQPPLAPPSWLFPVMWTIIYLLMGISYYLLKQDNDNECLSKVYYLQLGVNLLWSIIFFLFKLRLLACIWIIILDILVCLMIYWFYNTKKISGYLNILYLVWILFATYLTIGIYVLN